MSDDDTPTERFRPRRGDDDGAPTERFDAVPGGSNGSAGSAGSIGSADSTGDADEGAPTERFDAVPVETTGEADDVPPRGVPHQDGADHDTEDVDNLFGGGDAPTRRLPSPVNDAPTERFGAAPTAPTARYGAATPSWQPAPDDIPVYAAPAPVGPPRSAPAARPKSSKGPLTALIIIGTLLVVGVVVLVLVLTSGTPAVVPSATPTPSETATPTPSETPSETPTPTPTETTPPAPEPASFVSFSPQDNTEISCPDDSSTVPLTFSWTSTGAEKAWIAAGETDARANPDAEVDPSGTYRDLTFDCSQETQIYTVSLENEDGELTSQSVTLRRALD